MSRIEQRLSSGSRFEDLAAYSRAVVDDLYVHVSGTIGGDPVTGEMPADVAQQARNAFAIIEQALATAGAGFADVVRSRIYLTAAEDLGAVLPILVETFGDCRPTNTTLLCGIPAPGAKIEIEVCARRPAP
jgi:enamine deaminase RidA (YjgF/YER057c/UK114 family)